MFFRPLDPGSGSGIQDGKKTQIQDLNFGNLVSKCLESNADNIKMPLTKVSVQVITKAILQLSIRLTTEPGNVIIWRAIAQLPPSPTPPFWLAVKYKTFSQTISFAEDITVVN